MPLSSYRPNRPVTTLIVFSLLIFGMFESILLEGPSRTRGNWQDSGKPQIGDRPAAAQEPFEVPLTPRIPSALTAVYEWKDYVWLGTEAGLYRCKHDGSEAVRITEVSSSVRCFLGDNDGLFVSTDEGLFETKTPLHAPMRLQVPAPARPPPLGSISSITKANADLWLGTSTGLFRWRRGGDQPAVNVFAPWGRLAVNCVVVDGNDLWIGTGGSGLRSCDTDSAVPTVKSAMFSANVSAIHVVGNSIWYATGHPANNGEPGKLRKVSTESLRGMMVPVKPGDKRDPPGDKIRTRCGFVKAIEAVDDRLWLAGEKGFDRFTPRDDGTEQKNVIPGEIVGLHRNGDTVWVITNAKLYGLEGFNAGTWTPKVTLIEAPPSSLFTDTHASIKWQVKDLGRRTNPELVVFDVVFTKEGITEEFRRVRAVRLEDSPGKPGSPTFGISEVLPAGKYEYEIHAWDLNWNEGVAAFEADGAEAALPRPFDVSSLALYRLKWIAAVGIPLLSLLALAVFYVPFGRFLVVWLGFQRYTLTPGICNEKFEVVPTGQRNTYRIEHMTSGSNSPIRPSKEEPLGKPWPPDTPWLRARRQELKDKNVLVYVRGEDYQYPFAHLIGGNWSKAVEAVVAGQVIKDSGTRQPSAATDRSEAAVAEHVTSNSNLKDESSHTDFCFAVLGYPHEEGTDDYLEGVLPEAEAVEKLFRKTRARVVSPKCALAGATPEHFKSALKGADIVHVATHASHKEIRFKDGSFGVNDIEALPKAEIRCRLLVLSACKAAEFENIDKSIANHFTFKGVNVLASLQRVDDKLCKYFFPAFYGYWLPRGDRLWRGLTSGNDLGSAIRMAAADWMNREEVENGQRSPSRDLGDTMSPVANSIDTFILFGDPSLQLRLQLRW